MLYSFPTFFPGPYFLIPQKILLINPKFHHNQFIALKFVDVEFSVHHTKKKNTGS